ncbi:phage portal protein [Kitasatospora sp. MAA19]|uniref:phage portal protein n=1 Tax=Kitasatospora sp. MAA19 TaxID=3035090 RepID=UPI0024750531|nr:phage portal protein [Kitasatospora sp. MAA19]
MKEYSKYYEGEQQKLAFSQMRYKAAFASVFEQWRDNFCGMIVDSANERMHVDSFSLPGESGTDKDAREFWQRSSMDALSTAVHLDAMIQGTAYVKVWEKAGEPLITPASADSMAVQYRTGSLTELDAAAHFTTDDWGRIGATLWTPTYVYEVPFGVTDWEQGNRTKNPLGVVPVVPFDNRARIQGRPFSDLANCIPIQDAINKTVMDALTASEMAAFPQRFVTGLEIQEDANGRPIEPFRVAVDKILQAEDPAAKFGSFPAADLGNYVTLVSMLLQHLSSVSRLPHHYFLVNGGSTPSGESIISAEAGLIAKVRERMLHFGEAWERVIRLCFAIKRDKRKDAFALETVWKDPEYRTEAQHIDALLKLRQLNVPEEQLWSDAGYSSAQIESFREMRKEDAKAAAEVQKLGPQPQHDPTALAAKKAASKPPQGNSGNINRKLHEAKK